MAENAPVADTVANTVAFPVPLILLTDRHLTDRHQADRYQAGRTLLEAVAAAVAGGLRMVVVREKDLPLEHRIGLADRLQELLAPVGGRVLLAGPAPGPDGSHLAAADPWPENRNGLLGRSCHRRQDLAAAAAAGADYATLSPVFRTASKPGYGPALGLRVLSVLTEPSPLPVYALGGITEPAQARRCALAGPAGVAVMGALMRAPDPAPVAAGLIAAVTGAGRHPNSCRHPNSWGEANSQ